MDNVELKKEVIGDQVDSVWPAWCEDCYQKVLISEVEQNDWIAAIRQSAVASGRALGLPQSFYEEWKYTDLSFLAKKNFHLPVKAEPKKDPVQTCILGWENHHYCCELVFVNGRYCNEMSRMPDQGQGIKMVSIERALVDTTCQQSIGLDIEDYLGVLLSHQDRFLVALNAALFQDGWLLVFDTATKLEKPVHIVHINTISEAVVSPRLVCVVNENSDVIITESYLDTNDTGCLSNGVAEYFVGENARVFYTKFVLHGESAVHLANLAAQVKRSASFSAQLFSFGGKLIRNQVDVKLVGEGGNVDLRGLTAVAKSQQVDNHIQVVHSARNSISNQIFKGIFNDQSHGVFSGAIIVEPEAQKTVAYQSSQNLLLSDDARVDTRPQLKIWADDVKCSHGATVGQLDEEALFYLRSRGMSENQARKLLIAAFANDLIMSSPNLKEVDRVELLLNGRLGFSS